MFRRKLGRAVKVEKNEQTGIVVAYFETGAARMYTPEEIGEHVVEVARQALIDPSKVDEAWYEFLRDVVGEEAMTKTIATVATLEANAEEVREHAN